MYISADGGSLCQSNQSGNLTFAKNLLTALYLYDKENRYEVYTFCDLEKHIGSNIYFKKITPKIGWMKLRVALEEALKPKDLFLAFNQSTPSFGTKKIISFCHGLSYYYFPEFYSNKEVARLNKQLKDMVKKSHKIIVSSIKVKRELLSIFPNLNKIETITFGIPFDVINSSIEKKREKIILALGFGQPIKNIDLIIQSVKQLNLNYKLCLIGDGDLRQISRQQLLSLYRKTSLYVSTSHYESFNFPILEALSSGCPVVAFDSSVIPELKPYVKIANKNNLIEIMKKTIMNPPRVDYDKLKEEFSWQRYVEKLKKLYKQI